jgi:hypothetical protein
MTPDGRRLLAPPRRGPERTGAPTFSVTIAAHDAAATIGEAIESALSQTRPPLEVIVVDDGSGDDTSRVVQSYGERVVLLQKAQGGVASARNMARRAARGEFVAILDADDVYLPQRLEALAELADARADLDILCSDALLELGGSVAATFFEGCAFEVDDQRAAILERCFCVAPAYRRSTLESVGGFDESLPTASDWDCVIRVLLGGAIAGAVDEPLYRYRLNDASLTADRVATPRDRLTLLEHVRATAELGDGERAALERSLGRQRASLVLTEAEAALRTGAPDARLRSLAAARTGGVRLRARLSALAAVLAPRAAARALERRDARGGRSHLRRSVEHRPPL